MTTSLQDNSSDIKNMLPGYVFLSANNPNGTKNGGVGIFYKESLPLRIRNDLSFDECLVCELNFGRKKIFFSVLYRNPAIKANSPDFLFFCHNFENMILNIKKEKHYALFVAGDFNSQSQSWYPDRASTPEGVSLDELFSKLTQIISEPTHFFREDCRPSCIDFILTDQPNLVLDSGVRPSLDPL